MSQCPFSNLLDPDTYKDGMPYKDLKEIRDAGPMVKIEDPITGIPYWAVTRIKEMDFVSKNPGLFSSAARSAFPMEMDEFTVEMQQNTIINMDPPLHQKVRRIVRNAFTPKRVDSYEAEFRKHAREIVDAVASQGECEFVEEVAAELPLIAILELLGVPLKDRKKFFQWTNTMIFADDPDMSISEEEGQLAAIEVIGYAMQLAAQHHEEPMDNITSALLDAELNGEPVSEDIFGWMFILILVGGNESTRTVMSQGMRLLMEHPEQLQYLVDNPDKISNAVEEMLRYNTAFISMRRTATEDVDVGGQLIKSGDKVILHYHTANHDEQVFGDDAMAFDVTRAERMPDLYNQLRSFGIGQHFCIGTHLARLELNVMFEEIIPRLRNPQFRGEPKYVRSFFVNAMKELNITFDPELAGATAA
ncbi:cytochrome P450 [Halieaceae bacterium IMCC8485]|jgi:cholest-4-en-3-one 26-monooxygenase|uniref:Cytochrome P450 n=1 Tax=Candidatus Seongchinamella marina TaxID=2518990 RepID=A0ABT3SVW5_9GAMM|nr:cytochrome P450 [Candidatus Seongchinamella marina]MBT3412440.1 cytochrome P450 [Halieaceae bacterium]MBT5008108.1 cytochrome P450 [Halieaceae bacterium]MBT6125866.1 cytochrome P450 [Halieaceae bacterium]MCX2974137.1 cytochrome P450 [Candidatus Seongchinamella marina]